ncbi:hypothetical protein ACQ4PT_067862 [Festuca glaucescens]
MAGDPAGDSTAGDSGTLPGSKFWALRSVVDEVQVAAVPETPVSSSSTDRWRISPSKEQGLSAREFKRLEKKRMMREAALLLASESPEGSGSNQQSNIWPDQQQNYNSTGFNGEFGSFDEGYYEGSNGYGQGNNAQFRYRRPYRQNFNNNRSTGGYNNSFQDRGRNVRPNGNRNFRPTPAAVEFQQVESQKPLAPNTQPLRKSAMAAAPQPNNPVNVQAVQSSDAPVTEVVSKTSKKADKTLCFRCGLTGHMAEACSAILCIYCEQATHLSKDCHLLNMPKPTAKVYGLYWSELRIFDVPSSDELEFRHDSGKVAWIKVDGGSLSVDQVIVELGWIVPGEHQWNLEKVEENVYKTIFLTKIDLARLVKISTVPIDATKGLFLIFDEWCSSPVDKFKLDEAWVRVSGCPYKLRCDYLALFAVGSLIGITKEVDMEFTRRHGVVRMYVQVTSIDQIPEGTDHIFEGEGYGITFEVEGYNHTVPPEVDMDEANLEDDANGLKEGDTQDKDITPKQVHSSEPSVAKNVDNGNKNLDAKKVTMFKLARFP